MNQPPDLALRVFTPHRVAAIVATLAEEDGVAPADSLEGTGLDEAALHAADTRISYQQTVVVFRNAIRHARDSDIALRAGSRMRLTAYGMFGYALLSSPTHAETMAFAAKYNRVIGPVADMHYTRTERSETFAYDVLTTDDPTDRLYGFSVEFAMSFHLRLCRDLYGEGFAVARVATAYARPAHADAFRRVFGVDAEFGRRANEMQVDPAWRNRTPRMPDAVTHAMARDLCAQVLTEMGRSGGIAAQVQRKLIEQMPWRFPNIDAMARELAVNPRTLRRRLVAEGTSYRDLLAEVRRRLAIEYLRKTGMTTEEIGSRLGYSDAANFRHAFVRWTGKTPHEYR